MSKTTSLKIGVVAGGERHEVVQEMLDHQGVCYERISSSMDLSKQFPIVLTPDDREQFYSLARESCTSESGIISVGRIVDLKGVLECLSGKRDERVDSFDLFVNKEEKKLGEVISRAFNDLDLPFVRKCFWPGDAKACFVVTHDVDWLTYSPFHKVVFRGKLGLRRMLKLIVAGVFRRSDYGWNIPEMIEAEKRYGAKPTFFFRTEYDSGIERLEESLDLIRNSNFEIGLHGYHDSHRTKDALKIELEKFEKMTGFSPKGIRYHILKLETPNSWRLEFEEGVEYDATFSYNRFFGYRGGICFPYFPFNGEGRIPLIELPTGFMDWTALHRGLRGSEFETYIENAKKAIEAYHGVLVTNFHNTYINSQTFPDVFKSFDSLLKTCLDGKYWAATASECANWWKYRALAQSDPIWDPDEKQVISYSAIPIHAVRNGLDVKIVSA